MRRISFPSSNAKGPNAENKDILKQAMHRETIFNMVLSEIPCQVFIKDPRDNFRYKVANKNFTDYYRIAEERVLEHTDYEIFETDVAEQLRSHDTAVCASPGKPFRFDEDISFNRTGNDVFKSLKICFKTADGHTYLLGVCVDVTDMDNMRKQLNNALRQAQLAAESKSNFFAAMSHEIRTPLNAVIGFSKLLEDDTLPREKQKEYLSDISTAGGQLLSLINDVLDLSKLKSGKMLFTAVPTDVESLVKSVCEVFRLSAFQKNIGLRYEIQKNMPALMLDKLRIRQILFNLIGNAVKFTDSGSVKVASSFKATDKSSGEFSVEISDTGCGINASDLENIFDSFVQAENLRGTRAAANGTGLGLSIVKSMTESMGGKISVRSKLGAGSVFKIEFKNLAYTKKDFAANPEGKDFPDFHDPLNLRVLAVDDVDLNLKLLESMLSKFGCSCVTARSAKIALTLLEKEKFDVILTDVWMPDMNGSEFARVVRGKFGGYNMKIVAISADVGNDHNFDLTVFDRILQKPLEPKLLKEVLLCFSSRIKA